MKWLIGSSQWANMIRLTRSFHWNRLNERKNIQKKSECTFVWLAISFQSSMICREHGICLDYNKMSLIASLQHVPLHILTDICCRGGIIYLFVCLFICLFIYLWFYLIMKRITEQFFVCPHVIWLFGTKMV